MQINTKSNLIAMPKTKIVPKQLYEYRNTTDIFQREVIMGLLRILNQRLTYTQIWEDTQDGYQEVTIPFFYDFSGGAGSSEKFILDNYMHWTDDECTSMGIKKLDGDFKPLPYGVITLDSTTIESGNISNRFVMGQYQKKIGGEMKSFVSFLYSIPLSMSFTINIGCDTMNTMWKIELAFRELFYKNMTFRFNYKGTVVPCRVGFPESISETKTSTYQFGAQNTDGTPDIKMQLSLSVETYLPVWDKENERPADNTIKSFKGGISIQNLTDEKGVTYYGDDHGKIKPLTIFEKACITTEQDVLLHWTYDYMRSDLLYVDIMYLEEGDDTYNIIETVENHDYYHLQINDDFVDNNILLDVIIPNQEDCIVINLPRIKFYADTDTNSVCAQTCVVVDRGYVMTDKNQIDAILCYENKSGKSIEKQIKINLLNGGIDEDNPVDMDCFVYGNKYNYKKIKLFIRDHLNQEIIAPFQGDDEWVYVF